MPSRYVMLAGVGTCQTGYESRGYGKGDGSHAEMTKPVDTDPKVII
jgi:hypothetical protein